MLGVQRTFDDLGAPLHSVPFCVVDLETTGASPSRDAITEIGAVRFRGGEPDGTFHTLVDPGRDIPPFITVLTGITHAMVVGAPRIEEALPSFLEFLGDAVLVGHNLRFDAGFLDAAAQRLGYGRLANRRVDTLALARRLVRREVRNLKLGTLAAHFRSPVEPRHRALDDARATAHVLWGLLERAGTLGVTHLDDLLRLPTARGSAHYGKIRLTDRLPRKPGVYLMHDRDGAVIYVGKAKDLRSRVRSYFHGDRRRGVDDLLRELHSIEHRVCATEVEAEVTELRLIAAHRPRWNRRSRPPRSTHWVRLTREPFPRLSVVRTLRPDTPFHLGPFRSRAAAHRVVHALWDALPLRRCTGPAGRRGPACAFSQLGVAVCPHDGTADPAAYREVVDRLVIGVLEDPPVLLDPLWARMTQLAAAERFEEAAEIRDRHRALAVALERRRTWSALQSAGVLWAEDAEGDGVLVESARLVASWNAAGAPPLHPRAVPEPIPAPRDWGEAEEAWLLWRWLSRPGVELVDAAAPLCLPARPVAARRPQPHRPAGPVRG